MIQNLIFGFYLLISDFLVETLKTNKSQNVLKLAKTSKTDYSLYNTVLFKKPGSFYEPKPTQHCKKYTAPTQPKILLCKFWSKHVSGCFQKNLYNIPFLDVQELHSRITQKNVSIFLYISVRQFLFRRLLSGRGLNNFLKAARCLGFSNYFKYFRFN